MDRMDAIEWRWGRVEQAATNPEFDRALLEFLKRVSDDVFERIEEMDPIIIDSCGASTVGQFAVPCIIKPDDQMHFLPFVLIGGGFMKRSHRARVGEIAHEFAHLLLGQEQGGEKAEGEADAEARSWGFTDEIDALEKEELAD